MIPGWTLILLLLGAGFLYLLFHDPRAAGRIATGVGQILFFIMKAVFNILASIGRLLGRLFGK